MASLLSKFRIDYSDLTVIPDITRKAGSVTKTFFEDIIKDFRGDPNESGKILQELAVFINPFHVT